MLVVFAFIFTNNKSEFSVDSVYGSHEIILKLVIINILQTDNCNMLMFL